MSRWQFVAFYHNEILVPFSLDFHLDILYMIWSISNGQLSTLSSNLEVLIGPDIFPIGWSKKFYVYQREHLTVKASIRNQAIFQRHNHTVSNSIFLTKSDKIECVLEKSISAQRRSPVNKSIQRRPDIFQREPFWILDKRDQNRTNLNLLRGIWLVPTGRSLVKFRLIFV